VVKSWRRDRAAKAAWLFGDLKYRRARILTAMELGELIPKDPKTVQATPPRLIKRGGPAPGPGGPEPVRIALIRQRAEAMRRG